MKKLTITIALMLVVALAMPAFGASFSDVAADHWAYNAINKLVAAGIVEGYPDGEFKGDQSMTRYEMAVMVSRALDNIVDEMEAMGQGLTTGQAEDVTAIVKSLNEKNAQGELSDAQAEEVADIVDALTFELRSELKVLGADVDALGKDVAELEAKVEAMDVPEDNIEFGMDITTKAQVAYYGEDELEERAVLELLQDGDALDENFLEDPDEFPSQERFWQEYDFNIAGNLGDADFNLQVDTITNLFMDERNVLNYTENDENDFEMDEALLEVSFDDTYVKIGDMPDYYPETYFLDEDFEGVEVMTNMYNIDFKAFAGGNDENNANNTNSGRGEMADEKYFGLTAAMDTELGTLFGKAYHARNAVDTDVIQEGYSSEKRYVDPSASYENTLVGLGLETEMNDVWTMGGEVIFGQYEDDNGNDGDDIYAVINSDYAVTDNFNLNAMVEHVGEEFVGIRNDLEEAFGDYTKAQIGADYQLTENNNVNGFVMFAQAGDLWEKPYKHGNNNSDDKMTVNIGLDNTYGKFTNRVFAEYTEADDFKKDNEEMLVGLGTDYLYDEKMTLGADLVYKTSEDVNGDLRDYVYLTGYADKQLRENISWLTEIMVIDGDARYDNFTLDERNAASLNYPDYSDLDLSTGNSQESGTGYALTTSLSIGF